MKYLIIIALTTSCALPFKYTKISPLDPDPKVKLKRSDKIERCVKALIGVHEVLPLEASIICMDIRKR